VARRLEQRYDTLVPVGHPNGPGADAGIFIGSRQLVERCLEFCRAVVDD
jgi:hypothetical protein